MSKLLVVFAAAMLLAYVSDRNTKAIVASGKRYSVWKDWAYLLLVVLLVLFAGLRTHYNDTQNYVRFYRMAPILAEFLSNPDNLNPFANPLFYLYQSFLRTCGFDAQALIFFSAAFSQICFLSFFKRYSSNFTYSIFIYFTLGTYVFTLAAIKQVLGMAFATLAFPYLENRKWGRYYLLILLSALTHTYALAFAVLPLFRVRPWRLFTFVFVAVIAVVMVNFEEAITEFMEQANDLGKTLEEIEVFADATINLFRLAVYAIPPVISLLFQRWVLHESTPRENVLIHMTILSFGFMSLGTQAGANMFGRMGNYFELGTICCLPAMLKKTFSTKSYYLIMAIACVGFMGFFVYANAINITFDRAYQSISLWEFLLG